MLQSDFPHLCTLSGSLTNLSSSSATSFKLEWMDFPLFQVNSFASFAYTACSFFEAHTKLLIVCIMQEDETIISFPQQSCVYADSQRQLMITKILLLIMITMTITPRKLHADPNWLKLYQFQCKRGVRQSTSHHGNTSWNHGNEVTTKLANIFLG